MPIVEVSPHQREDRADKPWAWWVTYFTSVLGGTAFIVFDEIYKEQLRVLAEAKTISPEQLSQLDNFFQYTGNFKYGLALGLVLGVGYAGVLLWGKDRLSPQVKELIGFWVPAMLFTALALCNIDTETVQLLPGSFGSPFLLDVPAGAIGIFVGAMVVELCGELAQRLIRWYR